MNHYWLFFIPGWPEPTVPAPVISAFLMLTRQSKLYISRYIDISGRFIAGERFNSDLVRTGFYRKPLKRSFMNTLDEAYPGNSDRVLVASLPGLFPLNLPSLLRQTALS
jgi:hypothetical protein